MRAVERLAGSPRPRILFVSHAMGGGVRRYIDDLARLLEDEAEVLLLQPRLDSHLELRWLREGEDLALWWRVVDDWASGVALLKALGIARVHLHHVHGLPQRVLELPATLACPHDVTVHDYFALCPGYHLTDGAGRFCGGDPGCQRCCEAAPPQWPLAIDQWRAAFGGFFARAERVIAPSADCAARVHAYFPDVTPVVWPHPSRDSAAAPATLRVLVPGALSPAKGFDVLQACVRDAAERKLPLHFRVVGYVARPVARWPAAPLTVTGEYPDERLAELIALERGDAIFFPAQCPETFSYTLSAALATELPIVATNLGALPERLAQRANARIVPWDAPPAAMNDALIAAARAPAPATAAMPGMSFEAYRELYAQPLRAGPRREASPLPRIEPAWSEAPPPRPSPWTFIGLVYDAIGCGRAIPLADIEQRSFEGDARYGDALGRLDIAHARLAEQDAELAAERARAAQAAARATAAEERLGTLQQSRSWKVTAPLRALGRWLRTVSSGP